MTWRNTLALGMVVLSVASCGVSSKIGSGARKDPDPVFLQKGDPAPYDGFLSCEDLFISMMKEAYRDAQ